MAQLLRITRLWVVDDDGYQYLRVGATGSGWFTRLQVNNEFDVTRNGRRYTYTAKLRGEKSLGINALMQEKYTWGDTFSFYLRRQYQPFYWQY